MEETAPKRSQESYEEVDLSDLLKQYYKRLFPTKLFCDWLEYGDSEYFFCNSLLHFVSGFSKKTVSEIYSNIENKQTNKKGNKHET